MGAMSELAHELALRANNYQGWRALLSEWDLASLSEESEFLRGLWASFTE